METAGSLNPIMIFLFSCMLGVGLGVVYDFFRIIRLILNPKNLGIFLQDILYFILSGIVTFLFVLAFNHGEARFYILAGEGIGWIAYHITIGEMFYRASNRIAKLLKDFFKNINIFKKPN